MIGIGYFAEHHGNNYPPFRSTQQEVPHKKQVLEYLSSCKVIAAAPGVMKDAFTNQTIPGEMLAYSDGEYYWGSEAIYYFDKYNLELPSEFLNKVIN